MERHIIPIDHVVFSTDTSSRSIMFTPPKRRFWQAERTFGNAFSKHFSNERSPNRVLTPLKSALKYVPECSFGEHTIISRRCVSSAYSTTIAPPPTATAQNTTVVHVEKKRFSLVHRTDGRVESGSTDRTHFRCARGDLFGREKKCDMARVSCRRVSWMRMHRVRRRVFPMICSRLRPNNPGCLC